jgi:hypothetical protein
MASSLLAVRPFVNRAVRELFVSGAISMKETIGRIISRSTRTKYGVAALIALLLFSTALLLSRATAQGEVPTPTFTIEEVVIDQSVTIQTSNFPAAQDFVVTMGPIGTLGINGTVVGVTNSGFGNSFVASYPIPPNLVGARQIAIRLESPQGYFSYNWFYNNLTPPDPVRVPSFTIEQVVINQSVTIQTHNFEPGRTFLVTMGPNGTLGINGTPVGTIFSGNGESILATFPIPANLVGLERIAIRAEATPFFAYNWFDNQPYSAPVAQPTFSICGVVRDQTVTIHTDVFPINRPFQVLMAPHGTLGVGGYVVGSFNSGPTGSGYATYPIPLGLQGLDRMAIRIEEIGGPHFSYNWFDNVTQGNCPPIVLPSP